jgi:hypothetical protein
LQPALSSSWPMRKAIQVMRWYVGAPLRSLAVTTSGELATASFLGHAKPQPAADLSVLTRGRRFAVLGFVHLRRLILSDPPLGAQPEAPLTVLQRTGLRPTSCGLRLSRTSGRA